MFSLCRGLGKEELIWFKVAVTLWKLTCNFQHTFIHGDVSVGKCYKPK